MRMPKQAPPVLRLPVVGFGGGITGNGNGISPSAPYCVTVFSQSGGAVIARQTIDASNDFEAAYKGRQIMQQYCPFIDCPYGTRRGAC